MIVVTALSAFGMAHVVAPATESIMGSLPRAKAGVGSAMNDTTRQVGGAVGVALLGSISASAFRPHVQDLLHGNVPGSLLAKVEVFLDKQTPSGFAWWGGHGPPYSVTRGTRVTVDVIVERQAPITLVIPAMRHLLGLEG